MAGGTALRVRVPEAEQRPAVALERGRQRGGEPVPLGRAEQGLSHARDDLAGGELRAADAERSGIEIREEAVERRRRVAVRRQRAPGVGRAPVRERAEPGLERLRLLPGERRRIDVGRDGAVEHEAPDPLGELLGVGGTELGPVRPAEEVQLVVAEGGPDPVEVAGGVGGADARQPAGVALAAPGREALRRLDQRGPLGVVVGRRVDGVERGGAGVVGAADRRAVVHAPRVEATMS